MTRKELVESLNDLWEKEGTAPFWFIVQGKTEPNDTDRNLVTWMDKNQIFYEVITGDPDTLDDIYENRQATHTAKRLGQKVVNLMNTKPEEEEGADLLALFVSEDPDANEDRPLNNVIQAVVDAGYKTYALNDGLIEVDLSTPEGEGTSEEEVEESPPPPAAAKKVPAKKTAAKKVAAEPAPVEEAPEITGMGEPEEWTREVLENLNLDQLKEIATEKGSELAPRTRMSTYIDAILGEKEEAPSVEVDRTDHYEHDDRQYLLRSDRRPVGGDRQAGDRAVEGTALASITRFLASEVGGGSKVR